MISTKDRDRKRNYTGKGWERKKQTFLNAYISKRMDNEKS